MHFDGETCTLEITKAELDDDAEYQCVAINNLGQASCSAELVVNEARIRPEIRDKLKPIEVKEGQKAKFEARISGIPEPLVDWYKDNDKVEDQGRFMIVDDEENEVFSLIIENCRPEDSGTYKCVAVNEEGEAESSAKLKVQEESRKPVIEEKVMAEPVKPVEGIVVNHMTLHPLFTFLTKLQLARHFFLAMAQLLSRDVIEEAVKAASVKPDKGTFGLREARFVLLWL